MGFYLFKVLVFLIALIYLEQTPFTTELRIFTRNYCQRLTSAVSPRMLSYIRLPKPVWLTLGFLFSGLGIAGIILPMMPGLVFFIAASFCFAKSSRKFLRKIIGHPKIGPQVMDWKRGRGMRMRTKLWAIFLVTSSLTYSIFFMVELVWVKWIILVSILGIDGYILSVKTRKPDPRVLSLKTSKREHVPENSNSHT